MCASAIRSSARGAPGPRLARVSAMHRDRAGERRRRLEADVAARIWELFERCPTLRGFSVQPGPGVPQERIARRLDEDLYLSDLAFHPLQDGDEAALVRDEVTSTLLELVDERPEAVPLLRGRTFARTLH
jgi:hypothetical protein